MWDAFYDWLNKPYVYKPDAYIFDSGNATRAAINYQANWIGTFNHLDAGGNGALMRILPAILFYQDHEPSVALRSIVEIAEMTHGHPESTACCLALHYFYQMNRLGKYEIALGMIRKNWPERNFSEPPNLCTGFVTDTLHAAIWSIETSMTLEEALVNTIMLGGDTDTNAQVTAQLWAIKTEFKQGFILPDYLLEGLRGKDTIMPIVQRFQAAIAK
jgi:ADP-ribosylglycohydrolase